MSMTESMVGIATALVNATVKVTKAIARATLKVTMATAKLAYRVLTFFVGIFFIPGAYIMRGKFLRGLVVFVLLIIIAVFTAGFGLIIALPMAAADAATC